MGTPRNSSQGEYVTFLVTNLIKLGGLIVAINEALFEDPRDPVAFGIAALMMAGAQSVDTFFTSFFGWKEKR